LTPKIANERVEMSLKTTIMQIKRYIMFQLQIPENDSAEHIVTLHVLYSQNRVSRLDDPSATVLDLLESHWKDYRGLAISDLSAIGYEGASGPEMKKHFEYWRVLYYEINMKYLNNK
jgi:hypothetical protein